VGTHTVVLLSPGLDLLPGILDRHEPVAVQAFVPELAVETFDESVLVGLWRSSCRYQARRPDDSALGGQLRDLASRHSKWGYRTFYRLIRKKGDVVNHKRVWRVYKVEDLRLPRRV